MYTIRARNVNDAYERMLGAIHTHHLLQNSRNGFVLRVPEPMAIRYAKPRERVLFDAQRDANPFFHLFEAFWMLTGSAGVEVPCYFVPRFMEYSDNGRSFHGAYGYRWRQHFGSTVTHDTGIGAMEEFQCIDQLDAIVHALAANHDDRRAVLQMWDPGADLGKQGKDFPCNLSATFQIINGALCMTVFNRSNDAIWGALGANAVHFSILQEYLAARMAVDVGWYEQVSSNMHAYDAVWQKVWPIRQANTDPYQRLSSGVHHMPLVINPATWDADCRAIIDLVKYFGTVGYGKTPKLSGDNPIFDVAHKMYIAYRFHREGDYSAALEVIEGGLVMHNNLDWLVSAQQWLERRRARRAVSRS
jgi:hypothetical protein